MCLQAETRPRALARTATEKSKVSLESWNLEDATADSLANETKDQQHVRSLEHLTIGIRHRELARKLPLTELGVTAGGAKIQQAAGRLTIPSKSMDFVVVLYARRNHKPVRETKSLWCG